MLKTIYGDEIIDVVKHEDGHGVLALMKLKRQKEAKVYWLNYEWLVWESK